MSTLPRPLSEEIAIKSIRNFFRNTPFVFLGTGMSCAVDSRFGMPALQDALLDRIPRHSLTDRQTEEWSAVVEALKKGADLENSLNSINDDDLIRKLVNETGKFLASIDKETSGYISRNKKEWPAIHLIKRLYNTLPDHAALHILTPNYDMLVEHAFAESQIEYTNGFFGGVHKKIDWIAVSKALTEEKIKLFARKAKKIYPRKKHIRLYKVHGSLNYFFHKNTVIECDIWAWDPPEHASRVMITPGLSKYQELQRYRQELLQKADQEISSATCFLFVGYGFNDSHLEEYITRKLVTDSCAGLIVTRDSNPRIEALLAKASNLWLICKLEDSSSEGTRIYNRQYSTWLNLPEKKLWDIRYFTQIFGD